MKLIRAAGLLLPPRRTGLGYLAIAGLLLTAALAGLQLTDGVANLWGVRLHPSLGSTPEERLQAGFVEMVQHVWTIATLAWVCVWGMRPVLRTFEPSFCLFLRHGRRAKLFIETARLLSVAGILLIALLPFAFAVVIGRWHPGADALVQGNAFVSCVAASVTVISMVYLLGVSGAPSGMAAGLGIATPFFLTALAAFLRGEYPHWAERIPAGLPYGLEGHSDPQVQATLAVAGMMLGARLIAVWQTSVLVKRESPVMDATSDDLRQYTGG